MPPYPLARLPPRTRRQFPWSRNFFELDIVAASIIRLELPSVTRSGTSHSSRSELAVAEIRLEVNSCFREVLRKTDLLISSGPIVQLASLLRAVNNCKKYESASNWSQVCNPGSEVCLGPSEVSLNFSLHLAFRPSIKMPYSAPDLQHCL